MAATFNEQKKIYIHTYNFKCKTFKVCNKVNNIFVVEIWKRSSKMAGPFIFLFVLVVDAFSLQTNSLLFIYMGEKCSFHCWIGLFHLQHSQLDRIAVLCANTQLQSKKWENAKMEEGIRHKVNTFEELTITQYRMWKILSFVKCSK